MNGIEAMEYMLNNKGKEVKIIKDQIGALVGNKIKVEMKYTKGEGNGLTFVWSNNSVSVCLSIFLECEFEIVPKYTKEDITLNSVVTLQSGIKCCVMDRDGHKVLYNKERIGKSHGEASLLHHYNDDLSNRDNMPEYNIINIEYYDSQSEAIGVVLKGGCEEWQLKIL